MNPGFWPDSKSLGENLKARGNLFIATDFVIRSIVSSGNTTPHDSCHPISFCSCFIYALPHRGPGAISPAKQPKPGQGFLSPRCPPKTHTSSIISAFNTCEASRAAITATMEPVVAAVVAFIVQRWGACRRCSVHHGRFVYGAGKTFGQSAGLRVAASFEDAP